MNGENYIGVLSGDPNDEERNEKAKEMERLFQNFEEIRVKRDFYRSFSNLPSRIQKKVLISAVIALIVFLMCIGVFIFYYKHPMMLVIGLVIPFYLGIQAVSTLFYFRNMEFTEFTGKVVESYPMGNKLMKTDYFLIKLENKEGKTLCFQYYDKSPVYFDEELTLFVRKGTNVISGEYGPMIETYIDLMPTEDLNNRIKACNEKKKNGKEISIEQFVK